MTKIKVEKNIPLPQGRKNSGLAILVQEIISKLQIGDSTRVVVENRASFKSSLSYNGKIAGQTYTTSNEGENAVRVWRTA